MDANISLLILPQIQMIKQNPNILHKRPPADIQCYTQRLGQLGRDVQLRLDLEAKCATLEDAVFDYFEGFQPC